MEVSTFVYDYINFLDIKFNNTDLVRGGTYIKEDKWISNKKATINPKNNKGDDNYCFMYAVTVALNHAEINNHPERINKIIPYIKNCNWDRINFPSQRKNRERFEKDGTRPKQVVLLMITDGVKWHYLAFLQEFLQVMDI